MKRKNSSPLSLSDLQRKVARFSAERDWRKYHNPKSLALSILIEAGELAEHFQWETFEEAAEYRNDPVKKAEIAAELADVIIYCLELTEEMGIDPTEAVVKKLEYAKKKFPVKDVIHSDRNFYYRRRAEYRKQKK